MGSCCSVRTLSAYDARMRDGIRCPACGLIDWSRGEQTVIERETGSLCVEGTAPNRRAPASWRCTACGYVADEASAASRMLARAVFGRRFAELA